MSKTVIFSAKEGFWNDDDGWSFCPSEATLYDTPVGSEALFIGVDDAIFVSPSDYSHVDYDKAREVLFESLGQYNGKKVAKILTDISGDQFSYIGNSLWQVNDRTFDDNNVLEFLSEGADIDDNKMLSILSEHAGGRFYSDNDGGFYRHEPMLSF
jgi:hypothetical protein